SLVHTPRRHLTSPLFPYTTLFRSTAELFLADGANVTVVGRRERSLQEIGSRDGNRAFVIAADLSDEKQTEECVARATEMMGGLRSEEHTSELQSLTNLVCRLLLQK